MTVESAQKIAEARLRAREKWLKEHPEATLADYGRAHRILANLEIIKDWPPEGTSSEEDSGKTAKEVD